MGYEAQSPIHKRNRNASKSISDKFLWSSEPERGKGDNWPMDISDAQLSKFQLSRSRPTGSEGFWDRFIRVLA